MRSSDIPKLRLHNQQIARPKLRSPAEVVAHMGAIQAQDYGGGKWGVGLRTRIGTDAAVERAIAARKIVRTWPMRGTLHFVAAEDVRWMLRLLAPRVIKGAGARYRQLELDERAFARGGEVLAKALDGGQPVTRRRLHGALEEAGVARPEARSHILGRHAMDGLICFGPIDGKQQTFVLLDEWLPKTRELEGDEALGELAVRYFTSHGPATGADFAWWSGLTLREVRRGVEVAGDRLVEEMIDGTMYWMAPAGTVRRERSPSAHLLPPFDEYTVAYRDRSAVILPDVRPVSRGGIFDPIVVIDGMVRGTWKRKDAVVTVAPFAKLTVGERAAVEDAAGRYGRFLGTSVEVQA